MFGSAIDTARVTVARPSPKVKLVAKLIPENGVTERVVPVIKNVEKMENVFQLLAKILKHPAVELLAVTT